MDSVLPFHLRKLTGLKSSVKALVLSLLLAVSAWSGFPVLGGLIFFLASFRTYWSFEPDRVRVRWLFLTFSVLGYVVAASVSSALALLSVTVGFFLALSVTFAILELRVSDGDFWYRLTSTVGIWGIATVGFYGGFPGFSPVPVLIAVTITTREYLRLGSKTPTRRAWLVGGAVGIISFELFRIVSLLPFGAIRGAAALALIVGFLRDLAGRGAEREPVLAGSLVRWGFLEFLFVAFGVLLLAAVSSWDLP